MTSPWTDHWEYHVEQTEIVERWSGKRQAEEIAKFTARLNQLGQQGWEMVGFESVPLMGGITGQQKGYAYLTFFKRRAA
jgi:hypothetical protein